MTDKLKCWICGAPGAELERTRLGFKKRVCQPGRGCFSRRKKP